MSHFFNILTICSNVLVLFWIHKTERRLAELESVDWMLDHVGGVDRD